MTQNPSWANHVDLVPFYSNHRNRPEDLYPSERRFLPWLAAQVDTVLDVGCAAGGFMDIWRTFNPSIRYTGVDVSAELIEAARKLHPDAEFLPGNCADGIPLGDRYANAVQALGWLHWQREYASAIEELWRLTERFLFFDIRLVDNPNHATIGKQKLSLMGRWDGMTTVPYVLVDWMSLATLLGRLQPTLILGYGYWGSPSESVIDINQPVCFATFVCEKSLPTRPHHKTTICLDMPLAWHGPLFPEFDVLPPLSLNQIIALPPTNI